MATRKELNSRFSPNGSKPDCKNIPTYSDCKYSPVFPYWEYNLSSVKSKRIISRYLACTTRYASVLSLTLASALVQKMAYKWFLKSLQSNFIFNVLRYIILYFWTLVRKIYSQRSYTWERKKKIIISSRKIVMLWILLIKINLQGWTFVELYNLEHINTYI